MQLVANLGCTCTILSESDCGLSSWVGNVSRVEPHFENGSRPREDPDASDPSVPQSTSGDWVPSFAQTASVPRGDDIQNRGDALSATHTPMHDNIQNRGGSQKLL